MAQQHIDFGTFPNDPTADPLRAAFEKIQQNFDELYNAQLATGVERLTTGAGLTQNRQTGNVTIVANIPNITVQTSSNLMVGVGVATGNSATISSYSTPIFLNLSNSISTGNANITNIRVSNITVTNSVGSSLTPNVDDSYSLGTSSYRWKDASISDSITLGTDAVMTANGSSVVATTFQANASFVTGNIVINGVTNTANIPSANIPNLTISNLSASNNITVAGNISVTGNSTVSGNSSITGRTTTGTLTTTANANVGNLGTSGLIVATGNITGGNLVTGGIVNATGNVNAGNILSGGVVTATGNITGSNLITSGIVSATGNVNGGNLVTAGNAVVTGTITGGNITAGTTVKAQIGTITSNATIGNNLTVANTITANTINANLDVNTANLTATGNASVTGNAAVTGNATIGGNLSVTGKVNAATGVIVGNLTIGNIETSGGVKSSTLTITANANVGNLGSSGIIVSTGNITGGNLVTGGVVNATGNVTGGNLVTGGALSVIGNANVGNLGSGGLIVATGNITGGNLVTGGALSVTGNGAMNNLSVTNLITGATGNFTTVNTSGNINVGNITANNSITANVQLLSPLVRVSNANITGDVDNTIVISNTRITNNATIVGNATIGNANVVSSAKINGALTVVGNTSASNVAVSSALTTNSFTANYVIGNLIPASNVTYNLGNTTNRWKDLFLSGNTIQLGVQSISSTVDGIATDSLLLGGLLDVGGTIVDDGGVTLTGTGTIGFTNSPTTLSPTTLSIGGVGSSSAVSLNFQNNMLQSDKAIAAPVINVTNYITVQQINLSNDAKILSDNSGRVVVNSLKSQNDVIASTLTADSVQSPTISLSGVSISSDGKGTVLLPAMSVAGEGTFNTLVVDKAADVGSLTATTVAGTITDANQPYIQQLPNLKEITVDQLNVNNLDVAENATVQGTVSAAQVATDKVTYVTNTVVLPAPGVTGSFIFNDGGNAAAVPGMNFDTKNQLLSLSGSISSGNLTSTGILAVTANATISGTATLGEIVSKGAAKINGNLNAGNITTTAIDGTVITISGNVSGANLVSSGVVKAASSDISGLFKAGSGNIAGDHFIGGFANIQGGALIKGDANIQGKLGGVTQITTSGLANLASMLVVGATELKDALTGTKASFSGNVTVGNLVLGTLLMTSDGLDAGKKAITGGTFTASLFSGNGASITNLNSMNSSVTLVITATAGAGGVVTISYASQSFVPFLVGGTVTIAGVTPTAYNGTFTVLTANATAVTFNHTATGAMTVAGTISGQARSASSNYADLATAASEAYKVTGANVTGKVANATYSDTAKTATTATTADLANAISLGAYSNITGVGTLGALSVTNRISAGSFSGDGSLLTGINGLNVSTVNLAKQVSENAQSNITSVGVMSGLTIGYSSAGASTLTNPTKAAIEGGWAIFNVAGNTTSGGIITPGATSLTVGGVITGNGSGLSSINGANVSKVPTATLADSAKAISGANITAQTGMWTSAARPGPYRLYRRDADDAYSVQTNYVSGNTRWRLTGYYGNDVAHAGVEVSFADSAAAVPWSGLSSVPTTPTFTSLGIGSTVSTTGIADGEIRATNNITAYASSDRRLKEDIKNIENALEKVRSLNGVFFNWTQEFIDTHGGEDDLFMRRADTGIIAQEVEQVLPEVVATRSDGYKAVRYEKMVGLLIEAIKEIDDKVDSIKTHLGI